jgi:cytochrome b pre-mRNA-processing protein 3
VFDAFCRDMDHNLREMGISDQGVPRQMQQVGEAFYGRAQAYERRWPSAARRWRRRCPQCLSGAPRPRCGRALAAYVRQAVEMLGRAAARGSWRAGCAFPEPRCCTGGGVTR